MGSVARCRERSGDPVTRPDELTPTSIGLHGSERRHQQCWRGANDRPERWGVSGRNSTQSYDEIPVPQVIQAVSDQTSVTDGGPPAARSTAPAPGR